MSFFFSFYLPFRAVFLPKSRLISVGKHFSAPKTLSQLARGQKTSHFVFATMGRPLHQLPKFQNSQLVQPIRHPRSKFQLPKLTLECTGASRKTTSNIFGSCVVGSLITQNHPPPTFIVCTFFLFQLTSLPVVVQCVRPKIGKRKKALPTYQSH